MSWRSSIIAASFAATLIGAAAPAPAQDIDPFPIPAVELSAGYVYLRQSTDLEETYPRGWYVAGAANLNRWFGIVVETGGSYGSREELAPWGDTYSGKNSLYTFLAGGRFFGKTGPRIVPFGQLLGGLVYGRTESTYTHPGPDPYVSTGTREHNLFALQPGGGVTVYVARRVGVRAAVDYRWVMDFDEGVTSIGQFRTLAGVTYHWGGR